MEPNARERGPSALLLAIGASALFVALYVSRLCPTVSLTGDSAELVTAAALWGVPHAPGYPLFTTLAHLFTWLPLGTVAWRVHLTSALFHGGAVGVTVLATHAITRSRVAAVVAGCALGLERSFFVGSLYADVFPLNDLLFASVLLVALRVRRGEASARTLAFAAGIAAAHHMMSALAAPAIAVLALPALVAERRRWPHWLGLVATFALPTVVAGVLLLVAASRDPWLSWGDVHDARSFLALVTRSDYGGLLSPVHGGGRGGGPERVLAFADLLADGFGPWTLLLAAAGMADLLHRERSVGVALVLAALLTGPIFAWRNGLGTGTEEALAFFERFATMCTVPIAIACGAGVAAFLAAAGAGASRWRSRAGRVAGALALAAWGLASFARVRAIDLRGDVRGAAFAHDLVSSTPDGSLLLLSGDAPASAALYVCAVERRCGARVALSPGSLFLPWAMAQARRRHPEIDIPWTSGPGLRRTHELAAREVPKRPVFVYPDLLVKDPLLSSAFTLLPDHLLFRVWPRDTAPSETEAPFLASARALAGVESGNRCEGCLLAAPEDHPTQEVQLAHAYEAAAFNHAHAAADVPAAHDLVPSLLARAGAYAADDQRGAESRSRNSSSSSR